MLIRKTAVYQDEQETYCCEYSTLYKTIPVMSHLYSTYIQDNCSRVWNSTNIAPHFARHRAALCSACKALHTRTLDISHTWTSLYTHPYTLLLLLLDLLLLSCAIKTFPWLHFCSSSGFCFLTAVFFFVFFFCRFGPILTFALLPYIKKYIHRFRCLLWLLAGAILLTYMCVSLI